MNQRQRKNSASDAWEADPWDATDEVANAQLSGFQNRAVKPIVWSAVRDAASSVFGVGIQKLIGSDVEFYASHDGEDMLLMALAWHGFPDPPEWRLATRPSEQPNNEWESWGYFPELPQVWEIPERNNAPNQ